MENKTAVEWLKIELEHDSGMELKKWISDLFQAALELEKQQIIDSYCDGRLSIIEKKVISSDQYYSETYKKPPT